jgi:hypothetical protein
MRHLSLIALAACCLALGAPTSAESHELRPALLEIREAGEQTFDVLWKVPGRGDRRLALYVRFPESCEALGRPVVYASGDAFIERWKVVCPDGLVGETITVDGLATTMTDVLVRLEWDGGATETVRLDAATTGFVVAGAPSWYRLAAAYTMTGVEHILLGVDHLLFVLGLMLIVRDRWALLKTITAFTAAHSITLALAVFGVVNVPSPPVDAAIALSIVFLAAEIIHADRGRVGLTARFPWVVSFGFGLLHGLGFAGALTSLGLPQGDIPIALLFFNGGVEIGQLMFVVFFLMLGWSLRTLEVRRPRWSEPLPAYSIGTVAMYWLIGRLLVILPV